MGNVHYNTCSTSYFSFILVPTVATQNAEENTSLHRILWEDKDLVNKCNVTICNNPEENHFDTAAHYGTDGHVI